MLAVIILAPLATLAAQPAPDLFLNPDTILAIPAPSPMTIRPRIFGSYGALITAAMLVILYLYRGRAFIVYWIGSWLLASAALMLMAHGYRDVRLGSVMLGMSQLCGVWSAGLALLAANTFPTASMRWNAPFKLAAATAVWFLSAPFVLPLRIVLASGAGVIGVLFGWSAVRYLELTSRARGASRCSLTVLASASV